MPRMNLLPRPWVLFFCLFAVFAFGAGCAKAPPVASSTARVAILDGTMAEGRGETRRSVAGWWFSSRNRYDNGNAGSQVAETLAREFRQMDGVIVYPRADVATYMAGKERILAREYPGLTPEERLLVLQEQDPLDYGRSLEVDFVMTSVVNESRLIHNRAFHWWLSSVDYDLTVWDVERGEAVWTWYGRDRDLFSSQTAVMEDLAQEAREAAIAADVFGVYGMPNF